MHSAIENRCRHESVYTVDQWFQFIREARAKKPYIVNQMDQTEYLDYGKLAECLNWDIIAISELQEITFNPSKRTVVVKYDLSYHPEDVDIEKKNRNWKVHVLQLGYTAKIDLSKEKTNDLNELCRNQIIPEQHWSFYDSKT